MRSWGYLSSTPRWWYLGHAKDICLMTRVQVRPKEDNVRPKVVDVGLITCDHPVCAISTVGLRPSLSYKGWEGPSSRGNATSKQP